MQLDRLDDSAIVKHSIRPCLDVNTFVSLMQRGMSQADIARAYRRTPQAISEWKKVHANEIYQLLQPDSFLAQKFKIEAINALDSISQKDRDSASYLQKMTGAGIAITKFRELIGRTVSDASRDIVINIHNALFVSKDQKAIDVTPAKVE